MPIACGGSAVEGRPGAGGSGGAAATAGAAGHVAPSPGVTNPGTSSGSSPTTVTTGVAGGFGNGGIAGALGVGGNVARGDGGKGDDGGTARDDGGAARDDAGGDDAATGPGSDRGCGPGSGSGLSSSADPARAYAEKQGMATLERLVGQFVGGSAGVYRGTVKAHDNQSVFGQGLTDLDIPMGPALADLQPSFDSGTSGIGASLFIYSAAAREYIQLQQPKAAPGTTNIYMIDPYGTTGGRFGPCVNCAPLFSALPKTIVVNNASGTYTDVGLTTTVSTNLTLASPCSVTYSDLQTLNEPDGFADFAMVGSELVSHVRGGYFEPNSNMCGFLTPYTIDLFFDPARPWVFGLRNYQAGARAMQCPV